MLVIDIGNSKAKVALFDGDEIKDLHTYDTADLRDPSFLLKEMGRIPENRIAYSCVVPSIGKQLVSVCEKEHITCFDVKSAQQPIVKVHYNIDELGGDRLANAVAAFRCYVPPVLAVDFGTATTYNIVLKDGTFDGGAIAPGIKTCIDFLIQRSGLLPEIPLRVPDGVAGHSSEEALVSGFYHTFTGQFKEISKKIAGHIGCEFTTVGTGGMVDFAKQAFPHIIVDRHLTVMGIRMLYDANRGLQEMQ